ncbi:hypothetical protein APTSU1_001856400 [Apodemus speciosus]|uniref:Uncharacterized protein n=1 Tax=Apodemus speciosus TaxID=105296 RepID=A0ABQ0FVP6_APOSI
MSNASSIVRKSFAHKGIMFILKSLEEDKIELEKNSVPPEAVEAKLEVKTCVDQMGDEYRYIIVYTLLCSFALYSQQATNEVDLTFCGNT